MIITDLKILRKKSKDFIGTKKEFKEIIKKLEIELKNCKMNGVGLCAIQIGIPIKIAIIRSKNLNLNLYNAKILEGSGIFIFNGEGCLSFPNKFIDTQRLEKITVLNGDGKKYHLNGLEAIIVQHEIDHQNGIIIFDRKFEGD
jgi:peptide deformylase